GIEFKTAADINHVYINGEEVTDEIRSPMVTSLVSEVSAHKGVREAMVAKQRELGAQGSIVAEGRDTTTVVFPRADLKIYLSAAVKTRAERRLIDMARMGVSTTVDELVADIERRDKHDSERKHSPLTRARDAFVVDTSNVSVDEQVDQILAHFKSVTK
ncbi:MAG: (d)CMP kinase, partial [candidate division Zixibacteria bacterium]|nr:(d)CMP kinase [candidate division Zixibacteria bacterium]